MSNKKSMFQAISEFSDKMAKFEKSEEKQIVKKTDENKFLQKLINLTDEERKERIKKELDSFINPFTQDVEQDEQNLVDAYNFYKTIKAQNEEEVKKDGIGLDSLLVTCPLCAKREYVLEHKFIFLRIWFVFYKKIDDFVPEIVTTKDGKILLNFIEAENWKMTAFEKEIAGNLEENKE